MVEGAGAEGISGTGGLDGCRVEEALLISLDVLVVGLGSIGAVGRKDKRDLVLIDDHLNALVEVLLAGHKGDLIVGDLEDVALGETPADLLFCLFLAAPERRAEIRVKGNDTAGLFRDLHSFLCGFFDIVVRHGKRAEMEDPRAFDQGSAGCDFVLCQHNVRTRLAIEGEVSVAVGKLFNKGQGRMDFLVHKKSGHVDALTARAGLEHTAEHVIADLAQEGCLFSRLGQHGEHIAGRSAGICLKKGVSLITQSILHKIDQKLTQGCHIILFFHTRYILHVIANKWDYIKNRKFILLQIVSEKNRFHQFLKLWIGAGILPLRLTNSSQPKRLTGMMGA